MGCNEESVVGIDYDICSECWWYQFDKKLKKMVCLKSGKEVNADDKAPEKCFKQFVY